LVAGARYTLEKKTPRKLLDFAFELEKLRIRERYEPVFIVIGLAA
jgi:hypothetical protein